VNIKLLSILSNADRCGTGRVLDGLSPGDWIRDKAGMLSVLTSPPTATLKGKHLINVLGLEPGKHFGPMLKAAAEHEIDTGETGIEALLKVAVKAGETNDTKGKS
jgi:hypothetical protein